MTTATALHPCYTEGVRLGEEITELYAYISAATYRLLKLIGEFDEERYWELPGLCSCAHWLNFKCGIGMNAAREKVRVANALKGLPRISAAFERGEVSYSKVRAMTRIADQENESYLLMIARHGTAHHVEKLVSSYRRCKRLEETEQANEQHASRGLNYFHDEDGCLVIHCRLPAEQGGVIFKALELAMERSDQDRVEESVQESEEEGDPGESPAGAAAASSRVSAETSNGDPSGRPPLVSRRADALAEIAESYLATEPAPVSTADRYQVIVHVTAETLREGEGADVTAVTRQNDVSHLESGPRVSAETSRRIACDASKVTLMTDGAGEPLSIGRKSRSIPPSIRRALRIRDKGCRFPGCTRSRFVDGHHIQHWSDGGETSLENLVQLCRHHHRLVHEGGFGCRKLSDGRLLFTDREGRPLSGPIHLPPQQFKEPIVWFQSQMPDLDIDAETCVTQWRGERIDWDLAVGHLFPH